MPLTPALQAQVAQYLDGAEEPSRQALDALRHLPDADKDDVSLELGAGLAMLAQRAKRIRAMAALADLNRPNAAAALAARLAPPPPEAEEWGRYWAMVAFARLTPPPAGLHALLQDRRNTDTSIWVRAMAARLLLAHGFEPVAAFQALLQNEHSDQRLAACRALRSEQGATPLQEADEMAVVGHLTAIVRNGDELEEVRCQAAVALGDLPHVWTHALQALDEVRQGSAPAQIRRACLNALLRMNRPDVRPALLAALRDADAEVSARAADGLRDLLGAGGAVAAIVEQALAQDQPAAGDLDALRRIDRRGAAHLLAVNLTDPDPTTRARAARALTSLGGDLLLRVLEAQPREPDQNQEAMATSLNNVLGKAATAASVGMVLHVFLFFLAVAGLILGVIVALADDSPGRFVGIGLGTISLVTLLLLVYWNPLRNLRKALAGLVKVQTAFLGARYQINQAEGLAHPLYWASAASSPEQRRDALRQVQATLRETFEQVDGFLGPG